MASRIPPEKIPEKSPGKALETLGKTTQWRGQGASQLQEQEGSLRNGETTETNLLLLAQSLLPENQSQTWEASCSLEMYFISSLHLILRWINIENV